MGVLELGPDRRGLCFRLKQSWYSESHVLQHTMFKLDCCSTGKRFFKFCCWILVSGQLAIMFRFGTILFPLTVVVRLEISHTYDDAVDNVIRKLEIRVIHGR